jgi:hypothetical protein
VGGLRPRNENSKLRAADKEFVASRFMNSNQNPDDPMLSRVLRVARPGAELPPRFREGVWRRIAEAETPVRDDVKNSWLDAVAVLAFRPRFAVAAAALLIFAGAVFGAHEASSLARREAQVRYLTAVAPGTLR